METRALVLHAWLKDGFGDNRRATNLCQQGYCHGDGRGKLSIRRIWMVMAGVEVCCGGWGWQGLGLACQAARCDPPTWELGTIRVSYETTSLVKGMGIDGSLDC
jgi:hypothetical protein